MNWLQRLFGMDAQDDPAEAVAPDTVVWVANLPLWQTPLIITGLESHGIDATFADVSSSRSSAKADVYVRERDRAAATSIIAKLTAHRGDRQPKRFGPGR